MLRTPRCFAVRNNGTSEKINPGSKPAAQADAGQEFPCQWMRDSRSLRS
jgi:hypothetical protein